MAAITEVQRIATSGARAVEFFRLDGMEILAVPQLAYDVPGHEPGMNGGDSSTTLLLLRRKGNAFEPWAELDAPGGEDAEYFTIGERSFLAVATVRTGSGPYCYSADSTIFEWNGITFEPFQRVATVAAKQWKYWQIGSRRFLGLAQGVELPGGEFSNTASMVFEWDGVEFVEYQQIPSRWAYNWHAFTIGDDAFVAHADHLDPSVLYRWDGERLQTHQILMPIGGRAFATFDAAGATYLIAAAIAAPVRVLRWDGETFSVVQTLDGLGARELTVLRRDGRLFVVRVNFILGTPADPHPVLDSQVYEWRSGSLREVANFPTVGGTDVAVLDCGTQFVVSNSLTPDIRFTSESVCYAFTPDAGRRRR